VSDPATVTVRVMLPGVLRELAGGARELPVAVAGSGAGSTGGATVGDVLAELRSAYPVLGRRMCDETGALRRHVNVFVDGDSVRDREGLATGVRDGTVLDVLPSIAGG
jgi:molybdopterin converting factor small subunit